MDLGLRGRVALVCGGTRGLGRAVANILTEEGAQVAVNGRDAKTAPFPADVTVPAQAEKLVQDVARKFGRLDIIFCNAGGPPAAAFKELPADAWQKAIELNLLSTIHLARAAVPIMSTAKWGRIICLASIAALQPLPGLILSSTARAGVLGFAKALSDEVAKDGITVNS
ncbi:MAG TPA: SDR family NAD(P)-dependent oxidoreductase, partial [Gemmatimonadales bacterium]|nr:SDR family NAD(P)-dependent oxidoreductase [Gemmatimonadales bacterium]